MNKRSLRISAGRTLSWLFLLAFLIVIAALPSGVVAQRAYAVTATDLHAAADTIFQNIDSMQTSLNEIRAIHDQAVAEQDEAIWQRDETARQIEEQTAQVSHLQERLSAFAVSMYKDNGANTFLGVLLQTTSFSDFVASWERCTIITDVGKSLLQEEREAREQLEQSKAAYEEHAKQAEQKARVAESSMAQIEAMQASLRDEANKLSEEAARIEEQERLEAEEKEKEEEKGAKSKKPTATGEDAREAETESAIKEEELEKRVREAANAATTAAASAHAEVGATVLMGDGYFTNPCPDSTTSSGFGYRDFDNAFHKGLDMAAPQGTPYYAADSGTVTAVTNDGGDNGGAGNWIVIAHGNGIVTKYMHSLTTFVQVGDQVERGQNIGLVGSTGQSTGPHLHFQVEVDGVAVNPVNYI